jgi:hypothetical protein
MPTSKRRSNHNRRVMAYRAKLQATGFAKQTPTLAHEHEQAGFKEGWRYDVDATKSRELEALLQLPFNSIDATRGARYLGGNVWQCWTLTGRRCDVIVINKQIKSATITSAPDPLLPEPMKG